MKNLLVLAAALVALTQLEGCESLRMSPERAQAVTQALQNASNTMNAARAPAPVVCTTTQNGVFLNTVCN